MGDLFAFILLNLLGVMSPGPDFAIVTQYGLAGSRKAALQATFGIAAALVIHVLYCVSGIALLVQSSTILFVSVKLLGSLYLVYLGLKMFRSFQEAQESEKKARQKNAFTEGFLVNLLNPKATVFLLSLFTLFASSINTLPMKFAFATSIPLIALVWFSFLSFSITHPRVLPFLQKKQKIFIRCMSLLLVALGALGIGSSLHTLFS